MRIIQRRLILTVFLAIVVSTLLVGGMGIFSSSNVVTKDSSKIMNCTCQKKADELNSLLSRVKQSVETLANYTADRIKSADLLKHDISYVDKATDDIKGLTYTIAENTAGSICAYVRYSHELISKKHAGFFLSRNNAADSYSDTELTDISRYSKDDVEHVGWYYIPKQKGTGSWLNPYLNKNISLYMISYVVPIYDEKDGEFIGVVGMDVDFGMITKSIDNMRVYDSGYSFLTNSEGTFVYHPEKDVRNYSKEKNTLVELKDVLKHNSSDNELYEYRFENIDKKLAFCKLDNDMYLHLTAPSKEIDRERNELILRIFIVTLLCTVVFVVVTVFIAKRIIKIAYIDSLTGTFNRTAYLDAVEKVNDSIKNTDSVFSVMVFDINNLKKVNDTYGHEIGDKLIKNAAKILFKIFDKIPIYRIGGDEFAVVLDDTSEEYKEAIAKMLDSQIYIDNKKRSDKRCNVSIAKGYAKFDKVTDIDFSGAFKRADGEMYSNKQDMKKNQQSD